MSSFLTGIASIVFAIIAFPLLWWNEGRAVDTAKALDAGQEIAVTASADKVDPANEGKLVHMTSTAVTDDVLRDDLFGISKKGIFLKRTVEMYQWEEKSRSKKEKNNPPEYKKVWSESAIDSSNFEEQGHSNPGPFPFENKSRRAQNVSFGAFKLNHDLIQQIDNDKELVLSQDILKLAQKNNPKIKLINNQLYIGENPGQPAIGDIRVSFSYIDPKVKVSILAKQTNNTFSSFEIEGRDHKISRLDIGVHSKDQMFAMAQDENKIMTWILRAVGFILMWVGFGAFINAFTSFLSNIPILGDIVDAGVTIISFLMAAGLSLLTISLSWIFYRPLVGIILLVIVAGFIFAIFKLRKKKEAPAS